MNAFRKAILSAAIAAPLVLATAAFAHDGPRGPGAQGPRVEQRLADLKGKLNITGGQESQWQAFQQRITESATQMRGQFAKPPAAATAPDRLAERAERMKQHAASMEGVAGALKDLYAVLTADQRSVIDQHYARMGRRGEHGPRAEGHGRGHGHMHGHMHGHGRGQGEMARGGRMFGAPQGEVSGPGGQTGGA